MARPQNRFAHGEHGLARLAASYAFGTSRNHPFLDGNKRTSLVAAELFLELNGLELTANDVQCVTTFLQLAAGEQGEEQLAEWIAGHSRPSAAANFFTR
jgi:death-on-curing protein